MWGIGIASERKMRIQANELVGDNLSAELVPFSFPHKDGGEIIKDVPYAYIPCLWRKVNDLLDQSSDDKRGYTDYCYIKKPVLNANITIVCTVLPGTKEPFRRMRSG